MIMATNSYITVFSLFYLQVHAVGKVTDASLNKFPNLVQLWSNKNIFDIIDQLIVLYGTHRSTEVLSMYTLSWIVLMKQ